MVINYKVDPSKVSILSSVVHCGIAMNKRWLYGLYICLSKELSISGSGSLYIINLRSASATTAFSPHQIISPPPHFTKRTRNTQQHQAVSKQGKFSLLRTFNPLCLKVDLGSFVKVSHDLQFINLLSTLNSYLSIV